MFLSHVQITRQIKHMLCYKLQKTAVTTWVRLHTKIDWFRDAVIDTTELYFSV